MNILKTIKTQLHTFRLTDTERADIRVHLAHHMNTYVPQRSRATASPYHYHAWKKRLTAGVASLVMVMITGGTGLAYASFDALPGETLYGIKVTTEEVQSAIKTSPESRARFEVERVERRINEAVTLAARGTLDEKNKATISKNLKRHTEKVAFETSKLSKEEPEKAIEVSARLAVTLEAQKEVIINTATSTELAIISEQIIAAQVQAKEEKASATEILIASGNSEVTVEKLSAKKNRITLALADLTKKTTEPTTARTDNKEPVVTIATAPTISTDTERALSTASEMTSMPTFFIAASLTPEETVAALVAEADALIAIGNFTDAFLKLQEAEDLLLKLELKKQAAEVVVDAQELTPTESVETKPVITETIPLEQSLQNTKPEPVLEKQSLETETKTATLHL